MSKRIIFIIAIIIIIVGILWFGLRGRVQKNLVNPQILQTESPSPSPSQTPKTFKFDSSTNLKMELEKVNPEVLDSDFE